jgi:hypothetical protein
VSEATPLPWKVGPTADTVDDANGNELLELHSHFMAPGELKGYYRQVDLPYRANAHLIVRAVNNHAALLAACKELREAVAALFRVCYDSDLDVTEAYGAELKRIGIADGFGVRAQAAIAKAEEE